MRKYAPFIHLQAALLLCIGGPAARAAPDVKFIEGGYAQMCASAAQNLDTLTSFTITGSRLPLSAVEVCTLAIREGDRDAANPAGSYNNRGVLRFAQGDFAGSLRDFDKARRLTDTLPEVDVNRGYALVALERWAEAVEAFDRGIAQGAPELAKAYHSRGIAHEELGNVRQAYYDYLEAAELDPEWETPREELSRFEVKR
jgi:tetratricopeptide (TPR) repeat protein